MAAILDGIQDRFNGITVTTFPNDAILFNKQLKNSLQRWIENKNAGIWLKIPIDKTVCVPVAISQGFEVHHAQKEYIMLTKWLPTDVPNLLPKYATHYIGIGGLVLNSKNQILCVAERFARDNKTRFKLPGGLIDAGESLAAGVEREVFEETGLKVKFENVTSFRHNLDYPGGFGNSDMYFCAFCKPIDENQQIKLDSNEIAKCEWVNVDDFLKNPDVYSFNKVIVDIAMQKSKVAGEGLGMVKDDLDTKTGALASYYKKGAHVYHVGPHRNVDDLVVPSSGTQKL